MFAMDSVTPRKGKVFSSSGNVVAFLDSHIQVTVRTVSCQLLSTFKKCQHIGIAVGVSEVQVISVT